MKKGKGCDRRLGLTLLDSTTCSGTLEIPLLLLFPCRRSWPDGRMASLCFTFVLVLLSSHPFVSIDGFHVSRTCMRWICVLCCWSLVSGVWWKVDTRHHTHTRTHTHTDKAQDRHADGWTAKKLPSLSHTTNPGIFRDFPDALDSVTWSCSSGVGSPA